MNDEFENVSKTALLKAIIDLQKRQDDLEKRISDVSRNQAAWQNRIIHGGQQPAPAWWPFA